MLLWGLPIVGIPVLIHLINMMRHRRVEWAAMEFLLASQKKNRTWVLLKQLLLLLMRMAAVAIVVLMVAQPLLKSEFGDFLGGSKTHHIVLLDDSFSMSDCWADTSAFDQAKAAIERIGIEAGRQTEPQSFTLLRFSQAGKLGQGTHPDLLDETIDVAFAIRLRETLEPLEPSQTGTGPAPALDAVVQLLGDGDGENRIVYLVTDFRARHWDEPADLRNRLEDFNRMGATLQLINCVETARQNLAITALAPGFGTRAAGVPLAMEVTVANFGTAPVKDVPVLLQTDGQPQPAARIAEIPPGEAVTERFAVHFPRAGEHQVVARLQSDVVAADDRRYSVVDVPVDLPVLLIDGALEALDAQYLSAALAPGGPVATGITPWIEKPRYLSLNPLDHFSAVYLLNVDRLDSSAVRALEEYVSAGGGLGIFLGERSSSRFINEELYRNGEGLFPLPLAGPTELLVDRLQKSPDLEVGSHPVFKILAGRRNSFVSTVVVHRYFAAVQGWKPDPRSGVEVIARLRNGAPLAVERRYGEGRVVALLTTAAPVWNNWARANPSYVVSMLQLQAFLSSDPAAEAARLVGAPVELELDPVLYENRVRFSPPAESEASAATVEATASPDGVLVASLTDTLTAGVYRGEITAKDGSSEDRSWAINVDPGEGDLRIVEGPQLAARLEGVKYEYTSASMFSYTMEDMAGYNLSESLLYLLILLLIGEQILAWSASYHPSSRRPIPAGGGPR